MDAITRAHRSQGEKVKCQGKVEMSPSWQSRNVPFCLRLSEVHVNVRVPVKRRRALLASNPNSSADDEMERGPPATFCYLGSGPTNGRRHGPTPGFGLVLATI